MTSVDRFGIASLRTTEGPRRLPDHGLTSAALAWFCAYRIDDMLTTDPDEWTKTLDWEVVFSLLMGEALLGYQREPGTLGDYLETADTCEPDGTRICTVDDLLAFRKDG